VTSGGRLNDEAYARRNHSLGHCGPCDKVIHLTRKNARRAARKTPNGDRPRAYPCPHVKGHWHVGHLPEDVRHGRIDRGRFRQTLRIDP
jgi:hypothetical protein